MDSRMLFTGEVEAVVLDSAIPEPDWKPASMADVLFWKVRNAARREWLVGEAVDQAARIFTRLTGVPTIVGELRAVHICPASRADAERIGAIRAELASRSHELDWLTASALVNELEALLARRIRIDLGVLSRRLVTDAGVAFLVDDWDSDATDITTMHFHASGTGTTGAAVGDTALEAEATTITERATGTESQPAANQLRTIGTQSYTGSAAITEHGVLSSVTEGAGTLWDRHTFAAINVVNGSDIQWTYTCTINSGG